MYCSKCGNSLRDDKVKFCEQCGNQINHDKIEIVNNGNELNKEIEKNSMPFLIWGIVLAFVCNLLFGIAVILINELKYKPCLKEGKTKEAKNIKTIMIVLLCIGFALGILSNVLYFILQLIVEFA